MTKKIDAFFNDDHQTSYIFSSDHGMGDRGAHGDGHPDNTQTPLICWGAGINGPSKPNKLSSDHLSKAWDLEDIGRFDVEQGDVAPLMVMYFFAESFFIFFQSSLIGVPFPLNSVGILPLPYLKNTPQYKSEAIFSNAKQILAQYIKKQRDKARTEMLFKDFKPLINYQALLDEVEGLILTGKYEDAEKRTLSFLKLCIDGLRYYQT